MTIVHRATTRARSALLPLKLNRAFAASIPLAGLAYTTAQTNSVVALTVEKSASDRMQNWNWHIQNTDIAQDDTPFMSISPIRIT